MHQEKALSDQAMAGRDQIIQMQRTTKDAQQRALRKAGE
jgi:hypothetical protein